MVKKKGVHLGEMKSVSFATEALIAFYNATIYVSVSNTTAFESLKLVKHFIVIKI
jgi:hypothetical protein